MADFNLGGMKVNRNMLLISGAAAGGIVFYAYMKRRGSADTISTGNTTNPDSGTINDPNIDPSTGLPYSDEYGSGYSAIPYGVSDPNTGYNYWAANQAVTSVSTNAQWAQIATEYLVNQGEYNRSAVVAAIGKALSGQPLNQDELAIYDAAVAYEGNPPQGATIVQSSSSTSGSSTSTVKPGWAFNQKVTATTATTATLSWSAAKNATGYNIYVNGQKKRSTADTTITISGLTHNTLYTFGIIPYNHYGDGPASHVQGRTKK